MKYYAAFLIPLLLFSCRYRTAIEPLSLTSEYTSGLTVTSAGHRASLLADERVFVSGLSGNGFVHEMYNPSLRSWEPVAASPNSFEYHGMMSLEDGRILLAGGYQRENISDSKTAIGTHVQIFDPKTDDWTEAANLNIGRAFFSMASLDNGKLMAIGGIYWDESGSRGSVRTTSSVEFYDPVTDVWTFGPSMLNARINQEQVILADGRILILGGDVNEFSGEIYSPIQNSWSEIARPSIEFRSEYRAALLDGDHVILTGGQIEGIEGSRISAIYSVSENSWELVGNMVEPRYGHSLLSLGDGKVLAIGGRSKLNDHPFYPYVEAIGSCEIYDMKTNAWHLAGDLQTTRTGHVSLELSTGQFLTVGGNNEPDKGGEIQFLK